MAENPLISKINILKNASKIVHVSKTSLDELRINVTGIEKIILNREMFELTLKGDFSSFKEVVCPFDGKLLHLNLDTDERFSAFSGLKKVQFLRVDFKNSLDIIELTKVLTDTPKLWLISNEGDFRRRKTANSLGFSASFQRNRQKMGNRYFGVRRNWGSLSAFGTFYHNDRATNRRFL